MAMAGIGEIAGPHLHMVGEAGGPRRRDDVHQRQLFDRLAVQRAVDDQPLDQLAADHAGRAGDENVHSFPAPYSPSFVFCLPSLSKFSGASQRSNAALRAGHSLSSMEK